MFRSVDFPGFEGVFEAGHVNSGGDAVGDELDAFKFEAGALLVGGGAAEFDFAAGAEDAMPGERVGWVSAEEAGYGAMVAGVSGCGGYCSVGADLACGDGEDHAAEGKVTLLIGEEGRAEELALGALEKKLVEGRLSRQTLLCGFCCRLCRHGSGAVNLLGLHTVTLWEDFFGRAKCVRQPPRRPWATAINPRITLTVQSCQNEAMRAPDGLVGT